MRRELVDLIECMSLRDASMNSENSISWHAHREAEQLADISMIDELKSFLVEKPSKV